MNHPLAVLVGRVSRTGIVAGLVWFAPGRAEAQAALEILGPDSATAVADSATVRHTVFIRNPLTAPVTLSVTLQVPSGGKTVPLSPRESLPQARGAAVSSLNLTFAIPTELKEKAFAGYLVVDDDRGSLLPATRWISVSPPARPVPPRKPFFGNVILIPLILAGATILISTFLVGRLLLRWMAGTPTWDFAKSWASTTTLATAFGNTVLAALLPKTTQEGLAVLTAVFAILVLIAPLAYNLSLRPVHGGDGEPRHEGKVFFYVLASGLTLWGVFGALYSGYLLISQIPWEGLTADRAIRLFTALPFVIGGLIMVYAVATIRRTVREQVRPEPTPSNVNAGATPALPPARAEFPLL